MLQTYACIQYTLHSNTQYKNESKHSEMGPVRQNPIQRTVRSVYMYVHCTVHNCCTAHNIAQNRPDNFPSYPPDNHHRSDDVYLRKDQSNDDCLEDKRGNYQVCSMQYCVQQLCTVQCTHTCIHVCYVSVYGE